MNNVPNGCSFLEPFAAAKDSPRPQRGWLRAVREATGITLRQMAARLKKAPSLESSFFGCKALRSLKLNIASRWEAFAKLLMLLAVSLSTPSSQRAEAFRNLRKSAREPKLRKASAPLSTVWRWKIKPLEECRRK